MIVRRGSREKNRRSSRQEREEEKIESPNRNSGTLDFRVVREWNLIQTLDTSRAALLETKKLVIPAKLIGRSRLRFLQP